MSLCASLCCIYKAVSKRGYNIATAAELGGDVTYVADRFGIDPASAILLAGILEKGGAGRSADDQDLASFLGCTNIEFIQHHARLLRLERAGIILVLRNMGEMYRATGEAMDNQHHKDI